MSMCLYVSLYCSLCICVFLTCVNSVMVVNHCWLFHSVLEPHSTATQWSVWLPPCVIPHEPPPHSRRRVPSQGCRQLAIPAFVLLCSLCGSVAVWEIHPEWNCWVFCILNLTKSASLLSRMALSLCQHAYFRFSVALSSLLIIAHL